MNVVLLTWNPDKWNITDRTWDRQVKQTRECGFLYDQWSVGNSTKIVKPGDIAFLLRQSRDRGIIAKGIVSSEVFQEGSWDEDDEDEANYVDVTWDSLLPIADRLRIEDLQQKIPGVSWVRYSSGTTVEEQYHQAMLDLWDETVRNTGFTEFGPTTKNSTPQTLVQSQNGLCALCCIDSRDLYQMTPASFLTSFTFAGTQERIAVCPNCHRFASGLPDARTADDLRQLIGGQF